ncbi:sulfotransferase domain-containing protein [Aestuariivirga sp.]|uniref:sulfotransferase domain-containing protein n=1 Tax=Aestuariivirga sp. TaxID=2650926 RepID=UPI0035934105
MTDKIIMLASYPKTGSTWLRRLIIEALMKKGKLAEVIPSFLKTLPQNSPNFHLLGTTARIIKTHLHTLDKRVINMNVDLAGIITMRRHPLDVMLSSLNYAFLKENAATFIDGRPKPVDQIIADCEIDHYVDEFIANDGMTWLNLQSGGYSTYLNGWRRIGEAVPYYEICYEDMVADTRREAAGLLAFLGIPYDSAKVEDLIQVVDKRTQPDGRFYWSRRSYNFETRLSEETIQRFYKGYMPVLIDHGYGVLGRRDATSETATANQ